MTSIYHGSGTFPETYLKIIVHFLSYNKKISLLETFENAIFTFHFTQHQLDSFECKQLLKKKPQGHPEISRGTVVLGIFYMVYFYNNIHFVFYFLLYHTTFWLVPGTIILWCEMNIMIAILHIFLPISINMLNLNSSVLLSATTRFVHIVNKWLWSSRSHLFVHLL